MLRTSILRERGQLEAIADEWRELLADCSSPAPVSSPTWLLTWWDVFGRLEHRQLRAVEFRDAGGKLVGLAPLLRRFCLSPSRGLGGRRIELLASGEPPEQEISSDFIGVLARTHAEPDVAQALAAVLSSGELGGWDELRFTNMGDDSPFLRAFEPELQRDGCRVERIQQGASPFIRLPRTWEQYLQEIGGRRRYFVRRTLRDIEAWAGKDQLALHEASSREELRFASGVLERLHEERWRAAGGCGVFADPEFRVFHQRIVNEPFPARDGVVQMLWLTAGTKPIAALYNIVFDDKVWFYQMGRSMSVPSGVRPGIAIHALSIKHAIEHGWREYDFLGRERFYKLQLATDSRARVTLRAVRRGALPLAWEFARRYGRAAVHAARRLRKTPIQQLPDFLD